MITLLRKIRMATSVANDFDLDTVGMTAKSKMLKKRDDMLKNPFVLAGVVIPWTILIGALEPHSHRMSFAEHRYRIFLQFSTFVVVLSVATFMRRNKTLD